MKKGRLYRYAGALFLASLILPSLGSFSGIYLLRAVSWAGPVDPVTARMVANVAGMVSLSQVATPQPTNLGNYVQDINAAIRLGKALYWDMQVGSDGQACGSCHFHAGADNRAKNQINPGLNGADGAFGNNPFAGFLDFPGFGPNYTLTANDFPFHTLSDPGNTNSAVLRDTNDVVSSQGVFKATYNGSNPLLLHDDGTPVPDPVFQVAGINSRRVEPRNTPTVINAVFNFANFWDGRANMFFNGVNPFGPLDSASAIYANNNGTLTQQIVRIPFSSLASQAVGPVLSENEMSFVGRTFPEVGRKLLFRRPLAFQMVHPQDSVLGTLSRAVLNANQTVSGQPGLNTTYGAMIQAAFLPQYWNSSQLINGYTLMETNFSFYFGLAMQMYESTLVSNGSPFDRFMEGNNRALTDNQIRGLELFIGKGGCAACHTGGEFTDSSVTVAAVNPTLPGFSAAVVELMSMNDGFLSIYDALFHNTGVRPTAEDVGRGGTAPFLNPLTGKPYPLSFSRLSELKAQGLLPANVAAYVPTLDIRLPTNTRVAADGEFKTPGLRNVELTGPYFHNGGQATLRQVVDFYDRGGDFLDLNMPDSDPLAPFIGFTPGETDDVVAFLLSLTDERVRFEKAPFDHPQLFVPDGNPGDRNLITCITPGTTFQACDNVREIPLVGSLGRQAAGLGPLPTFLGLEQLPLQVGLSESLAGPQPVGTTLTFTAVPAGGSGSYEYRFLLGVGGGAATVVQPYSTNPSWTWVTTGLAENGYLVTVQARNAGSAAAFEASHDLPYVLGKPPATGVSLTAAPPSPQHSGALVTFNASASGPSGSFEYQFLLSVGGGAPTVVQSYNASPFWVWNTAGLADGTYGVTVQARTTGSTAPFEATSTVSYVVSATAPIVVTLASNPSGGTATGGVITYTATAVGGTGQYEYEFQARVAGGTFVLGQAYTRTNQWTWDSIGSPGGGYEIKVNVRTPGSIAAEATVTIPYTLTATQAAGATLASNPAGGTATGGSVTYTASAVGGTGPFEYEFQARVAGGTFVLGQAYTRTNQWTWDTIGSPAGGYEVKVNVRTVGSGTVGATTTIPYTLTAAPATGATLSANPPDNTASGNSVTYTATATGGTGPYEYEFQARVAGGTFVLGQAYTQTNHWTWDSIGSPAGGYEVKVNVRTAGSVAIEATATIPYSLQ